MLNSCKKLAILLAGFFAKPSHLRLGLFERKTISSINIIGLNDYNINFLPLHNFGFGIFCWVGKENMVFIKQILACFICFLS